MFDIQKKSNGCEFSTLLHISVRGGSIVHVSGAYFGAEEMLILDELMQSKEDGVYMVTRKAVGGNDRD